MGCCKTKKHRGSWRGVDCLLSAIVLFMIAVVDVSTSRRLGVLTCSWTKRYQHQWHVCRPSIFDPDGTSAFPIWHSDSVNVQQGRH